MSSFIFNEFKKRFLNGEVENNGTKWFFQPVKKEFIENLNGDNIKPEQFKTLDSIKNYLNRNSEDGFNKTLSELYKVEYEYSKLVEAKYSNKPAYITKDNYFDFIKTNPKEENLFNLFLSPAAIFPGYGGFYYVKTKEELKWCANRVNGDNDDGERSDNFNNHIVIVLGDDIGEINSATEINFTIGRYTDRPFEGFFYGNGYIFQNLKFKVTSAVGGLVGYLGHNGIILDVNVFGNTRVDCDKKINLNHIKNSAEDICFGVICAVNRGLIQNSRISGEAKDKQNNIPTITYKGFVPSVYLVQNKTENLNVPISDSKDNEFFPNYFCINSPGNIVPYVGYFAEGCPSIVSARPWVPEGNPPPPTPCWLDDTDEKDKISDWTGTMLLSDNAEKTEGIPADKDGFGNQFLTNYSNVKKTVDALNLGTVRSDKFGFDCMIPDNSQHSKTHQIVYNNNSNWSNQPVKMHQFARAAYYVSPFCGSNKGTIAGCESKTKAIFEGTFVGFCGGLVGKNGGGKITDCNVYIEPQDDVSATRDKLVVSAESNFATNAPHIDLRTDLWNWNNVYHQDLDDIVNRPDTTTLSANTLVSGADVYRQSDGDVEMQNLYHDTLGICQCPWHNTSQGIMLQFDGLSAESARATTYQYTFDDSTYSTLDSNSGNSALNVYNNAMNTGVFTSGEGYDFNLVSDVTKGVSKIHTNERMHRVFYDQFTNNNHKPVYENTSAYAVWFPLVKKDNTNVYYNTQYDAAINCYVLSGVEFNLGCGYEIVANSACLQPGGITQYDDYIPDSKEFIVDSVYPNFYDKDNNYLVRTQKASKYNYPNSTFGYDTEAWSATSANDENHTKIDRLSCADGNFTCAIEFKNPDNDNVIAYDNSKDFTSAATVVTPTILIDKVYLAPFYQNCKPDNLIKKYINNGNNYVEGYPLAIVKMDGIHIKNRYSSMKPKSQANGKSVITITDYELYIKSIGCVGAFNLRAGLNTQFPNTTLRFPTYAKEWFEYYFDHDTDIQRRQRAYIGNNALDINDIFEIEESVTDPFTSQHKPQYYMKVNASTSGESFYAELQSIYNVGGLIGSLAIAPKVTEIYNTSAFLNNKISEGLVVSANSALSAYTLIWNDVESKNYSFLDRFGGLAAVCEFNTSNISDDAVRPVQMLNVNLQYEEESNAQKTWDDFSNSANSAYYPKRSFFGPIQLNGTDDTCPFGIGSPIVAEIKPTYNMFPGINSYINSWKGNKTDVEPEESTPYEIHGHAYYGEFSNDLGFMYNDYNLGLYTLDLNCDLPVKNMNVDANANNADATGLKYGWMPGLKNGTFEKLTGGLPMLAESLFRGCHIKQNYFGYVNRNGEIVDGPGYRKTLSVLSTVHYPAAVSRDISLNAEHIHVFKQADGEGNGIYNYVPVKYQTSKHEATYSYFGSSLAIDNAQSGKHVHNDLWYSYETDVSACPMDGVDLTNAKLPNLSNFKQRNDADQFFTYTYTELNPSGTPQKLGEYSYNVKFGMSDNGIIGYWLEDPIAGISGDNFVYNHNIMHLGLTKSPEQIRKEIMNEANSGKCYTSALSGEDFAGLYVYDKDGNNIMYIDTSVGDCDGLSTWSMALSAGKVNNKPMGCILEIK